MAKYKITWLLRNGVGNNVIDYAKFILDVIGPDAEYIHDDVGWEFWKKEGKIKTYDFCRNNTSLEIIEEIVKEYKEH